MKLKLITLKSLMLLGGIIILFSGCILSGNDKSTTIRPIPANEIKSIECSGNLVLLTVNCTVPTPCWDYHHREANIHNTEVDITILGERISNGPCIQVISDIDVTFTVTLPSPGTYTFHLWQTDTSSIDTTLQIEF